MKTKLALTRRVALLVLLSTLNPQLSTWAQGTAFTYQGRLGDTGAPANGHYDLRFKLFTDPLGNNQAGGAVLTNGVSVADGLFTVTLDFGAAVFTGSNYWLEVDVKTNGASSYFNLSPLQALTPAPYAIFAENVGGGGLAAGTYGSVVTFNNAANQFTGSFTGNGGGLTNINAATLGGLGTSNFWSINGNAGTRPGTNFLGTTDTQPLELWVNQSRALRLEPDSNNFGAPNVIGGSPANLVDPGIIGATIAGGGVLNYTTNGYEPGVGSNHVSAVWGTIGGGRRNTVAADHSTIGGGHDNFIAAFAYDSVIGGGDFNSISNSDSQSVIAGGYGNRAIGYAAAMGGGANNTVSNSYATVAGGYNNTVNGYGASVSGGGYNTVSNYYATLAGGYNNTVNGYAASLGGGYFNSAAGQYASIPGGNNNLATGDYSFAAGRLASAAHAGAFVWADASTNSFFSSTASNQFSVHATGGVSFVTGGAGMTLDGQPVVTTAALNNLNAANITSGTLADARLSANVALLNAGLNTFAGDLAMSGGAAYHNLSLSGGNALGYLYGSFPAFGDGIHLGYNYYADANGTGHVFNAGGGTSRISVGYNSIILATGGVGVQPNFQNIAVIGTTVTVSGTMTVNGTLTVNGTFNNFSDRNAKQDFAPVSPSQILDKVMRLPVSEWSYKVDAATRHIGPVAQDFHSIFNIGTDDKHIAPIDEAGVAFAAIQALNQKLESDLAAQQKASESKIKGLEKENEDLRLRLEKVEQWMARTDVAAK
jgi:hypothetical protein